MQTVKVSPKDKDILRAVLDAFPDGAGIGVVRYAIRVFDKIDNCEELLLLEDAEVSFLLERFNAAKFIKADRDILALFDRIASPSPAPETLDEEAIPCR